jgi:hypothetical protein
MSVVHVKRLVYIYIYIYHFLLSGNTGLILRHGELPFHPHLFISNTNNVD